MRKAVILSVLLFGSIVFAAEQTCNLAVTGMTCNGCVTKIKSTLEKVDGVKSADVKLESGSATIVYLDDKTNEAALAKAVSDIGYKSGPMLAQANNEIPVAKEAVVKETEQPKVAKQGISCPGMTAKSASAKSCPAMKGEKASSENPATCGTSVKCKELTQFHSALHPMALAIGFEGDGKKDYAAVRATYPELKSKTDILAKMVCDGKCVKDLKAFNAKREELAKFVDELGIAIDGKDDAKIDPAFEKVHKGYVELAGLAK